LALLLTAEIAMMLDMSHKMFLRLGVLFCVAAGAPWLILAIEKAEGPSVPAWVGYSYLFIAVFDLIAASTSKGEATPPFNRLQRKRLIESRSDSPYRISTLGRATVRLQFGNQGGMTCRYAMKTPATSRQSAN
jgi:hypothetical protein